MPSERATVIAAIIIGILFMSIISLMDSRLSVRPPNVALLIDGKPHYGSLRTYSWSGGGGGGGAHYIPSASEVIEIESQTKVSLGGPLDREFAGIWFVRTDPEASFYLENLQDNEFVIDLPPGEYWLSVASRWEGRYNEAVFYEYRINVK